MRGFEKVSNVSGGILPVRGTSFSAGYDICSIEEVTIQPGSTKILSTGIKAYMQNDEVLEIYIRSSIGIKKHLMLANVVGIIDSDYYNNEANEGHIMIALHNYGNTEVVISQGERIVQGIFKKYLVANEIEVNKVRSGGIGSTN